jgi:hypothetical protein
MGQKRRFGDVHVTSASLPKTDVPRGWSRGLCKFSEHASDRSRRIRLSALAYETRRRQFLGNSSQRTPSPLGGFAPQLSSERNHVAVMVARINLCVVLSALHFDARGSLAISRRFQFANKASLLELGKYPRDLSHGNFERVVRLREIVSRGIAI